MGIAEQLDDNNAGFKRKVGLRMEVAVAQLLKAMKLQEGEQSSRAKAGSSKTRAGSSKTLLRAHHSRVAWDTKTRMAWATRTLLLPVSSRLEVSCSHCPSSSKATGKAMSNPKASPKASPTQEGTWEGMQLGPTPNRAGISSSQHSSRCLHGQMLAVT